MNQEKIQNFLRELPRMREDLPFSPEVLKQLFVQTGNNSMASLEEVGETLSKDQGLTTRILSLANSAYYGLQAEVQSVKRAAAVLGMGEIRNIVLVLGVNGLTSKYEMPEDFDLDEYWKHQFLVAMIAKELSRMTDVGATDNMFTVGLLHDIGKLITAMRRPDDWQAIHDLAEDEDMLAAEAEDEYWGLDHAVIGALVLKSWDLPADLVEPVNWHHAPELAPEHSNQSMIICLADYAAHAVEDPESAFSGRLNALCPEMDIDTGEVLEIAEELNESDEVEQFVRLLV
ncbi:HDOD domain-containing protein [Pseudodesulfovibrio piezophilus]|uniref:Metal dependent phosphohydrolase n=1 Tax=Pseudodesulfovibrio piezophilus (strain DSM 21447 / JCM 15486 / C1TLV30) TaxID=1322246 RepID=M1WSY5_PSEP2|nr:HDOD domain-containing protein [Pseudodesulfovibrio piezophilus]CCH50479.1 Metal dependent phosphohydrolase [Pseudodesulfovibrio piezophilus C1TLV30]